MNYDDLLEQVLGKIQLPRVYPEQLLGGSIVKRIIFTQHDGQHWLGLIKMYKKGEMLVVPLFNWALPNNPHISFFEALGIDFLDNGILYYLRDIADDLAEQFPFLLGKEKALGIPWNPPSSLSLSTSTITAPLETGQEVVVDPNGALETLRLGMKETSEFVMPLKSGASLRLSRLTPVDFH